MLRTLLLYVCVTAVSAFQFHPGPLYVRAHSRTALFGEEKIKFKIYSDGRVEETVIGVAGENCLKVTEKLNEKLGKVVTTKPTEEMSKEVAREKVNVYEQNKSEW